VTFRRLIEPSNSLDDEEKRATGEGLSGDELAMFDLLQKEGLDKSAREQVKRASKELLASIKARLKHLDRFWEKEQTKADIEVFILDEVFASLPTPPFSVEEKEQVAKSVYIHVWQQALRGDFSSSGTLTNF
jgi:type I restriction enzyme R subunit